MQNCPRHRSLRLCKNNPRIPFLLRRGPRRPIRHRWRRYGRRRRRRVALKRRASCRDSVSCLLRLAVAWSLGQCERAVVRRPWLAYWKLRRGKSGSAPFAAMCGGRMQAQTRSSVYTRRGGFAGRAERRCCSEHAGRGEGGRGRMARARGSRDAEWSSIGINAEGAPRFSEWDCEASSLPNPLEADFRRCSLLLPMLSSIPNLLEML